MALGSHAHLTGKRDRLSVRRSPDRPPGDDGWTVPQRPLAARGRVAEPDTTPARLRLSFRPAEPAAVTAPAPASVCDWVDVTLPVRVSVVIPTLNEAANLRHLLPSLPAGLHEVIVVDGYSTDGTVEVARELLPGVEIVRQSRRGKGNALAHGFAACTGDIIVMLDADGSADPAEMTLFITALLNGADFVKGSRYSAGGGSTDLTGIRSAGNFCLNRIVNGLFGTRFSDLCYGYNVFWRHCLPAMGLDELVESGPEQPVWGDGFEVETLMITRVAKAGLRVVEVPSIEHPRLHGETHLRTFADGTRVLRTALVERLQPAPPRVDLRPATGLPAEVGPVTGSAVVTVLENAASWDGLARLLPSLDAQTRRPDEVVVVVDGPVELVDRTVRRFPGRTVLANSRAPGRSGAVNTGFAATTAAVVLTVDVNSVPRPDWVELMVQTLEQHDDVGVVGGRTTTEWETGRPAWFPPEMDWVVGGTFRGTPHRIHEIRDPDGGNTAYRREVFERVGGLPESADVPGRGGQETELAARIGRVYPGTRILYRPDAVIRRRVTARESTWRHLIGRCADEGEAKAVLVDHAGVGAATSRDRGYVMRVLSRAAVEGALEAALTGRSAPLRRSGAVAAGLGAAGFAYARQRTRTLVRSAR